MSINNSGSKSVTNTIAATNDADGAVGAVFAFSFVLLLMMMMML